MRRITFLIGLAVVVLTAGGWALAVQMQPAPVNGLTLFTRYPAASLALSDTIRFPLVLRADVPQVFRHTVRELSQQLVYVRGLRILRTVPSSDMWRAVR